MNTEAKLLDLIPSTLHPKLFKEVAEKLEEKIKEQEKAEAEKKPTAEEIKRVFDLIN